MANRAFGNPISVWRSQTFQAEAGTIQTGTVIPCSRCSNGARVGATGSNLNVLFKNIRVANAGANNLIVYYANGDYASWNYSRQFAISVNGGAPQMRSFPIVAQGDWTALSSITVNVSGFVAGSNNTVSFAGSSTHPSPDLDWIEVIGNN